MSLESIFFNKKVLIHTAKVKKRHCAYQFTRLQVQDDDDDTERPWDHASPVHNMGDDVDDDGDRQQHRQ